MSSQLVKPIDHCTMFPEGSWGECCRIHDVAYETQVDKKQADIDLYNCVKESSDSFGIGLIALMMFIGVTTFGFPFYRKSRKK